MAEIVIEGEVQRSEAAFLTDSPEFAASVKAVVAKLKDLPEERGIRVKVVDKTGSQKVYQAIRVCAIRAGFNTLMRRTADGWMIFRVPLKARKVPGLGKPISDRDREICDRRAIGEPMETIAQDFGLSRQRVEQITARRFVEGFPPGERAKAMDEFCAPYLAAVRETRSCFFCCREMPEGENRVRGTCNDCAARIKVISNTASRLRHYKQDGDRHYLAEALVLIRKFKLQPDDLMLG